MSKLSESGLIRAAMDNSDGLLPSLQELANKSGASVRLDVDRLRAANGDDDDMLVRYWMGWGDWNVIALVSSGELRRAQDVSAAAGSVVIPIGELVAGAPVVEIQSGTRSILAPRLESERFAKDSWFSEGISGYISRLENIELP
jgi:thiamine-monophosphate kinase